MGWQYRKSINLGGGFRVNLSKSGLGYSWGTKGYRVTKTATGQTRTTYSIPGTGISYVQQNTNSKKKKANVSQNRPNVLQNNNTPQPISYENNNIYLTSESEVRNSNQAELIDKINTNIKKFNFTWLFAIAFGILTIVFYPLALLFVLLLPINKYFSDKKVINVDYELDEEASLKYNNFIQSLMNMRNSQGLWLINNAQSVYDMQQRKTNAGAGRLIKRNNLTHPAMIKANKIVKPYFIKTNESIVMLQFAGSCLLFLPDIILLKTGKNVVGLSYDNLIVSSSTTRFIEDGAVPRDAVIIDYTWQYVNKNGTPDKRYNNNRKLPICQYGSIKLSSVGGLNIEIQTSNIQVSQDVKTAIFIYTKSITDILTSPKAVIEPISPPLANPEKVVKQEEVTIKIDPHSPFALKDEISRFIEFKTVKGAE